MNLSYANIVSIKVVFFTILAIFAIPYYFYNGGTLIEFIIVRLIARFFGIFNGIGSHRWLCHHSFKPTRTGKYLMLIGILFGGYGKPLHVVIAHRAHHAHSDQPHDPHSPLHLTFLQMWLGRFKTLSHTRIPRDFFRDKQVVFLNNHYWKIFWIFNIVLALVDLKIALIFCPITFAYGWMLNTVVNYFGHKGHGIGPRNLNTALVWLTFGEGLHKNHHDAPNNYTFGNTTDIDPAKYFIDVIKIT